MTDRQQLAQLGFRLAQHLDDRGVLDGVTDAMDVHGLNTNDTGESSRFDRLIGRPVAELGPAFVSVDHVAKSKDGDAKYALPRSPRPITRRGTGEGVRAGGQERLHVPPPFPPFRVRGEPTRDQTRRVHQRCVRTEREASA